MILNISLVIITAIYVWLTFKTLKQTEYQSEILQKSYQETLRPYLLFEIDSIRAKSYVDSVYLKGRLFVNSRIINEGLTPAELQFVILDIQNYDISLENIRDTLLLADKVSEKLGNKIEGRFTKYIPAKYEFPYVTKFEGILIDSTFCDTLYLHALFIFQDTFDNFYDIYCVFKITINWKTGHLTYFAPPIYDVYEYTKDEVSPILKLQ